MPDPTELWCYETLRRLRWPHGMTCPRCSERRVTIHSKSTQSPRRKYLCLQCRRTFTDLTGTPFARTNLPLRTWALYLRWMEHGGRTSELAKALGVKWDTAALLQRRIAMARSGSGLSRQLCEVLQGPHKGESCGGGT